MNEQDYKKVNFEFEALDQCPLCEGKVMIPNGRITWLDADFWYVICPYCGLKFMNPRPTEKSYRDFYKDLFWQQKVRNLGFHQTGQLWQSIGYRSDWSDVTEWDPKEGREKFINKHRKKRVDSIVPVLQQYLTLDKDKKVLEVGCGFGVTLQEINKDYQCVVYAIEPSDESRKTIEEFKDINLIGRYAEELEEIAHKDELKFDVIIFSHALENTNDPLKVISFAKQCLNPGGVIYIQTPNLFIIDQMNPYHPYIFSKQSLFFLANKLGMEFTQESKSIEQMLIVIYKK